MIPFETLKAYFDIHIRGKPTEVGYFLPSPLEEINFALEQLLANETINSSELFFDAGFGDGGILLLTAGVHGIPSAGAEYDEELAELAEYHIREIEKLGIARGDMPPIILARGDFGRDETYSKAGIRFGDIATFYNYANNPRQIVEKIVRQSPLGTKFLYRGRHAPRDFEGLTLEQTIKFVHPNGSRRNALHVYKR